MYNMHLTQGGAPRFALRATQDRSLCPGLSNLSPLCSTDYDKRLFQQPHAALFRERHVVGAVKDKRDYTENETREDARIQMNSFPIWASNRSETGYSRTKESAHE